MAHRMEDYLNMGRRPPTAYQKVFSSMKAPSPFNRRHMNPYYRPALMAAMAAAAGGLYGKYAGKFSRSRRSQKKVEAATAVPVKVVRKLPKRSMPKKPKSLTKRVKNIEHKINDLTSLLTYRFIGLNRCLAAVKLAAYSIAYQSLPSTIETVLAQLRFFDPAAPGTLVTASGATGTYQRDYHFRVSTVYTIRNNYQVPCELRLYKYSCKTDTSIDPYTAFTNGLADIGNPSASSPVVYPSDSKQLAELWKLDATTIWLLKPGQQKTYSIHKPWTDYDPSEFDSETETYHKHLHSGALLFRVQGVPSHDATTTTELGFIAAGVDFSEKTTYQVKYNSGGATLNTLFVNDSQSAMAAGGLVSESPVADNIAYSAT